MPSIDRFFTDEYKARSQEKVKLTPAQKRALAAYEFQLREWDRYMGSVFVNRYGQEKADAKVKAAHDECVRLGMDHRHGL